VIKSGQDYRLQFVSDLILFRMLQSEFRTATGFTVGISTIRKFVKTNTKRSHVSKLDGCPHCHKLDHERESLSAEEIIKYEIHRNKCGEQQRFKQYILQAVAGI
jgi:hypothetical protein